MAQHHRHHDTLDLAAGFQFRRVAFARSADMNVTPLIDVLLVLLVIFIAALPLTQKGVDINLPLEAQKTQTQADPNQVVVKRDADGKVTVNGDAVELADLPARLGAIFAGRSEKTVFVNGDGSLAYGDVMPLIDAATANGLKVGIITPGLKAGR